MLFNLLTNMKQSKESLSNESAWDFTIPDFLMRPPVHLPKYSVARYLFILIIAGFLVNQFILARVNSGAISPNTQAAPAVSSQSKMTLTAFDQNMVSKLKNEGRPYPVLGTVHNHADITVFINGRQYDFAKPEYYMQSSFLHVDNNQNVEDAGSVLHMHATGVPLAWFFESLGMKIEKDSLTLADGEALKNENGNSLKFYLNGTKVGELGNYVFQPLDKLLISFGPENDPDTQKQIESIPNFAKDHQK